MTVTTESKLVDNGGIVEYLHKDDGKGRDEIRVDPILAD